MCCHCQWQVWSKLHSHQPYFPGGCKKKIFIINIICSFDSYWGACDAGKKKKNNSTRNEKFRFDKYQIAIIFNSAISPQFMWILCTCIPYSNGMVIFFFILRNSVETIHNGLKMRRRLFIYAFLVGNRSFFCLF